jgi:EAL domain-containing protein (putative c-di-GMP-specific phosphodiesterase class I)
LTFGTGYSSLSLLKQLPIDELKIDKSFVDDILSDERARKMIQSIILIGKQLNMNVLAEGIEKKEQKDLLQEYGCDLYQGYYFAKPLVINDLKEFILTH